MRPEKHAFGLDPRGLLANGSRVENIARARALPGVLPAAEANAAGTADKPGPDGSRVLPRPCPCCGGRMIVIEVIDRGRQAQHPFGSTRHDARYCRFQTAVLAIAAGPGPATPVLAPKRPAAAQNRLKAPPSALAGCAPAAASGRALSQEGPKCLLAPACSVLATTAALFKSP